jgi:Flp pilus assembly pilin Flp
MTAIYEVQAMKHIGRKLRALPRDEEGAETVEWVIVVAVLVVAIVGGLSFLGKSANNALSNVAGYMTAPPQTQQ